MFGGRGSGNRGYTLLAAVAREENRVGTRQGKGGEDSLARVFYIKIQTAASLPRIRQLSTLFTAAYLPPPLLRRCRVSCASHTLTYAPSVTVFAHRPFPPLSLSLPRWVRSGLREPSLPTTHAPSTTRLRLKRMHRFAVSSLLLKSYCITVSMREREREREEQLPTARLTHRWTRTKGRNGRRDSQMDETLSVYVCIYRGREREGERERRE